MLLGRVGPAWVACKLVACAPRVVIGCDQLAVGVGKYDSSTSAQNGSVVRLLPILAQLLYSPLDAAQGSWFGQMLAAPHAL